MRICKAASKMACLPLRLQIQGSGRSICNNRSRCSQHRCRSSSSSLRCCKVHRKACYLSNQGLEGRHHHSAVRKDHRPQDSTSLVQAVISLAIIANRLLWTETADEAGICSRAETVHFRRSNLRSRIKDGGRPPRPADEGSAERHRPAELADTLRLMTSQKPYRGSWHNCQARLSLQRMGPFLIGSTYYIC